MIWGWENPGFFFFAGALLLLLLLYLLKSKGQTFFTQALFLWEGESEQEKTSSVITLRKLPLSFYLEALALLMMVCGGASFFVVSKEKFPPAVVLLNNAYSMTPETRMRGEQALENYLSRFPGRQVVWVLCGSEPQRMGDENKAFSLRSNWNGTEPFFDAPRAVAWAKKNFPDAGIVLVSDRKPRNFIPGEVTLICCGRSGENFAITAAELKEGRVLLEAGSFSDHKRTLQLKVNGNLFETFDIAPGEKKLFNFQLEHSAPFLKFSLESPFDALEYDNHVTLVNKKQPPVTYSYGELAPEEKKALDGVLSGNPEFRHDPDNYELLFTRGTVQKKNPGVSQLLFHREKQSVIDRNPPFFMVEEDILSGLFNTSLVWAFSPELKLPGKGVIFSSSAVLMSCLRDNRRKFDLHLNLDLRYSNLPALPFWPGFFCNLARLCRLSREGIERSNVKSGMSLFFYTSPGAEKVHFKCGGEKGAFPVMGDKALVRLKKCGLYTLSDGKNSVLLAVNPHVSALSDLRQNNSAFFESKALPEEKHIRTFAGALFIAGALFFLFLNQYFLSRSSKK